MLLPALSAARERARSANCTANLNNIGKAIFIYSDQNKSYIPTFDGDGMNVEGKETNKIFKYGTSGDGDTTTAAPGNKLLLGGSMGSALKGVKKTTRKSLSNAPATVLTSTRLKLNPLLMSMLRSAPKQPPPSAV